MTRAQWLADLEENGYVVIPNVIPQSSCDTFQELALQLESFHGFKRDDITTWTDEHLPFGVKGGLYNRYSVNHEAFVWKIRTEPGIIKIFEQIWRTDDLIASFDGINVTLPINAATGRKDMEPTTPWPRKAFSDQEQQCKGLTMLQILTKTHETSPSSSSIKALQT
ncbi:hypothetical protein BAUCODRAFT_348165 [Baudoinia panamericana UAMH 10762]|uniref:Uncharacterized protein n=1 Tax=Baudoinia panamericana (strain UAMH 10762) TaxID=717646 RepID=M2NJX4_BAUPA|nr:uncharacterized protein BAUCODRAFT_348165 [Baudoinia panamericana UAMH 10762]EMC99729.1 hypothetical protein BAUCODRAFT_348165 [Baudoinia panamericana UAMH 10762]